MDNLLLDGNLAIVLQIGLGLLGSRSKLLLKQQGEEVATTLKQVLQTIDDVDKLMLAALDVTVKAKVGRPIATVWRRGCTAGTGPRARAASVPRLCAAPWSGSAPLTSLSHSPLACRAHRACPSLPSPQHIDAPELLPSNRTDDGTPRGNGSPTPSHSSV